MGNSVVILNREGFLCKIKPMVHMMLAEDYHVAPSRPWKDTLSWMHKLLNSWQIVKTTQLLNTDRGP